MEKVIAIDIDDTLNNFTEVLRETEFPYDKSYRVNEKQYNKYLSAIKSNNISDDMVDDYGFQGLWKMISLQCYDKTKIKPGASEFMQWLKNNGWKTIILTARNLQNSLDITKKFFSDNNIPYDYIFNSDTNGKVILCKCWDIPYLIDNDLYNIICGQKLDIQVFYPINSDIKSNIEQVEKNEDYKNMAKGFHNFDEVKQWIK